MARFCPVASQSGAYEFLILLATLATFTAGLPKKRRIHPLTAEDSVKDDFIPVSGAPDTRSGF